MALTTERQNELIALHEELKKTLVEIDNKYALSYQDVTIDFPESLGLEKKVYVAPTEEELYALAEQSVAAKYADKRRVMENTYLNNRRNIVHSADVSTARHLKKLSDLATAFRKKSAELNHKMINNNVYYSTLYTQVVENSISDYQTEVSNQNSHHQNEQENFDKKLNSLEEDYNKNLAALTEEQEKDIAATVNELREAEEKKRESVEQYNNNVNEKETKYKANCLRYQRYAQQAENERAIAAARLYAELGESGVIMQKKSEMFNYCKHVLLPLLKEEAHFVLSRDTVISSYLAEYYQTLVDWVDQTLF